MSSPVPTLRIGSRDSQLAVLQTQFMMRLLQAAHPELVLHLETFKTKGDIVLDTALSKIGDKGLFVKELEDALLQNRIDIAVHSMKDMPGELPPGLLVQAVGPREDARDVLISLNGQRFSELPAGSVIGTSSLRRIAQLKRCRPDLTYQNLRGNLQTRLNRLESGNYQAIVLAAAGVHRLGWHDRITEYFDPHQENIPAVGQGALAIEFRTSDHQTRTYLAAIQEPHVIAAVHAERAFLQRLQGGCQVPLGAYAYWNADTQCYQMAGVVLSPDGSQCIRAEQQFTSAETAEKAGYTLADQLLNQGAQEILTQLSPNPALRLELT